MILGMTCHWCGTHQSVEWHDHSGMLRRGTLMLCDFCSMGAQTQNGHLLGRTYDGNRMYEQGSRMFVQYAIDWPFDNLFPARAGHTYGVNMVSDPYITDAV